MATTSPDSSARRPIDAGRLGTAAIALALGDLEPEVGPGWAMISDATVPNAGVLLWIPMPNAVDLQSGAPLFLLDLCAWMEATNYLEPPADSTAVSEGAIR